MEISAPNINYNDQIKAWIEQGMDNEAILTNLQKMALNEQQIIDLQVLIKKIRNKKRTRNGSILVLVGIITLGLGFLSCIILHYLGNDINFSLYGLTAIGAVVLIVGLILIFS